MSRQDLGNAFVGIFVVGFFVSVFVGNFVPLVIALGLMGVLMFGMAKDQKQAKSRPQAAPRSNAKKAKQPRNVAQTKEKRGVTVAHPSPSPAHAAARRLRGHATHFDHAATSNFFSKSPVGVVRTTQAQEIVGPGVIQFHRRGFTITFRNQNSPDAKPREISKSWSHLLGFSGDGEFRMYFQDLSSVLFIPITPEDRVEISALWEIMSELSRPPLWDSGPRHTDTVVTLFRQTARFLDNNPGKVTADGSVDWSALNLDSRLMRPVVELLEDIPEEGDAFLGAILRKRLGQGHFGSVFVAVDEEEPGHLAALKFMKQPEDVEAWSDTFIRMAKGFLDESVLSSQFQHCPYIASSKDFGLEPWPWISYPLLDGVPVSGVTRLGRVNMTDWWNLAHDLVSALYFIHREGMVHRDIHSDNVMMVNGRAVLLDFGLSQVAGHAHLKNRLAYWPTAAPEALSASNPDEITEASDVFSAGMVLYRALTDHSPWPPASSRDEQYENITGIEPDFTGLPEIVRGILEPMLDRNPVNRPTAHEILWRIAPHVDMEKKAREIEESGKTAEEALSIELDLEQGEPYPDPPAIRGPLTSWQIIDEHIAWIVNEVRPRFFAVNIRTSAKPRDLYFQGITDGEGWVIEAMSERFAQRNYADAQREAFLRLDWGAPTQSSPNYQRHHDEHAPQDISQDFSDAFEFCYGLTLSDIKKVSFSIQGSNMYPGEGIL